jgi:hypothetical protein
MPSRTSHVRLRLGDLQGVFVVAEAASEVLLQRPVECLLAGMAEGRMSHVVAKTDRLDQVFVQPQSTRDAARDRRRLERVGHARAVVIACRVYEDLGLPLQPPERLRVQDSVAVVLERRA